MIRILRITLVVGSAGLLLFAPTPGTAQTISLKTVPIPTGEQFLLFPSARLGMGSVSIADYDALAAPFANPARRLATGAQIYATPTFYGETNNQVGGRSLPISGLIAGRHLHGAFGLALQQLNDAPARFTGLAEDGRNFIDNARSNSYLFGSLGALIDDRTSVGLSLFHADLGAVDGVNLLYAQSVAIEQDGELNEVRAGLAHDFGGDRRLEGTITTTRLSMTHDVRYMEWRWPAGPVWNQTPTIREWNEVNEDRTISWGAHLRYNQPFREGSRIGWILAATTKDHPKIPNYNIVNIPRDPGNSTVFNLGVGLSRVAGPITTGLDLLFEPGRSHTWAYADTIIKLPSGKDLRPGDKTVDNEFDFTNWSIGLGAERDTGTWGVQLGLRVRQINYELLQQNFLAERTRKTRESWMEWAPSWGAVARLGEVDLRYTGRFTAKGFQDPVWFGGRTAAFEADMAAPGVDFVVGATEPVLMPDYRVTVHRITLSMPF